MRTFYYTFCCFIFLMASCKSGQTTASSAEVNALQNLIESRSFKIESDWAYPQATNAMQQVLNSGIMFPNNNAGAINLNGNANFLKISGDSVQSYLPYFGERQMNVGYGGRDSAIQLEGVMKDYKVEINEDESRTISFQANGNNENYNVFIQLFPNKNSSIAINSNSRFPIRYNGMVEKIENSD